MGSRQISTTTTLLLLLLTVAAAAVPTTTDYNKHFETYTWGPFAQPSDFKFVGDSSISGGALQITPDSSNSNFSLTNRAGRITYQHPFRLRSAAAAAAASFTTNFTVNIFRPYANATPGEGLAFLIAADGGSIPAASSGLWLGLTNATTDGNATNRFVAVELDTVRNPEVGDPDGNHLGLDVNSVVSNVTVPLTPLGIELSPVDTANYTVWVDYSGATMGLEVYIAREHQPRPALAAINKTLDLGQIVGDEAYFGFAASTGDTAELNCVLFWNLSVEILPTNDGMGLKLGLGIGLPVAAVAVAAAAVAGWWWGWKKRCGREEDDGLNIEGAIKSLPGMPREFKLKELKKATNGFDEDQKLGEGGFGAVYRGWVNGATAGEPAKEVAVKKFLREDVKGMDDFLAELTIINRLRHKNLVKLVGWCHTNGMLLLVYDYMPNGSLDAQLFGGDGDGDVRPLLSWDRRGSILAGVAAALNYLHHEYNETVIHRDLKASNILLEGDFTARLGDFGLARAIDGGRTSYAHVATGGVPGTLGYIAPECFHTGKATRESDVFGFGAVVLEVVCGRRPRADVGDFYFLVDWVWSLHRDGRLLDAVDPRLTGDFPAGEAERLLKLGLACSHPIAGERPKTQAVVQIIAGSVPPPEVPRTKPAFVWPMAVGMDDVVDDEKSTSSYFGAHFANGDTYDYNSMVR